METTNTPLWLELRKEYIDDNFDKLQTYLKEASSGGSKDSFYDTTIKLLRSRIEDLINSLSCIPVYEDERDRKSLIFNVRLLATYLLVETDNPLAIAAYTAFMEELRLLNPRLSDRIIQTAVNRLFYEKIQVMGYNWIDLEKIGTDLFAHNACSLTKFETPIKKPLILSKNGTVILSKDGIYLTYENRDGAKKLMKAGADSLETDIKISVRTANNEKIKQSQENSLAAMNNFVRDFLSHKVTAAAKKPSVSLSPVFEGDEVTVVVTAVDSDGTVHVETADPKYRKLSGVIKYTKTSLVYYYTDTLYTYFHLGDYLKATVTSIEEGTFNIEKQLITFFVEDNKNWMTDGDVSLAKMIDEKPSYYEWITENGIAMQTKNNGLCQKGDFALLSVNRYGTGNFYGKIDAIIEEMSDNSFDEKTARHDCIRAFLEATEAPKPVQVEEEAGELSPVIIRLLIRQMASHQKSLMKPSDRYRYLACASIMANIIQDENAASYLQFARTYLLALVQFVAGESVKDTNLVPGEEFKNAKSTLIRLAIIDLLKEYGRKDNSEKLANAIRDFSESLPLLAKLARLIQTANSMQDTLSGASLNVIKREIIKALSFETENNADLEAEGGIYLGVESGTQEFKTSMVFPSNNKMQPDEFAQNMNVLRGVCAFLNSTTGGTLYLGVNDQGYVVGVANDMKYLQQQNIDTYMRYVQDTAKKHFGIDILPFLRIEPLYDNKVVAIHVEPHPYRVVELNNTAYLRVNAESREMPEQVRQQMIARKVFKDKNKAAAISLLQHAMSTKRCVILHNYASSNSGIVKDRLVEAYQVNPEDDLIICFDRNVSQVRMFNINRIGYVEILESEPWKFTASHKNVEIDIFHMTGPKPIHVSLQLDMMAKNLLVEEYPRAKDIVSEHKGDNNIWYLDTDVYALEGIGRFYVGLANHIKVLNAPELVTYVKDYTQKYL